MPSDIRKQLRDKVNQQELKSKQKPRKKFDLVKAKRVFGKRSSRLLIEYAATMMLAIKFKYRKITTGETKEYVADPYSYRYKKLREGRRKVLYAYDHKDKHIKNFAVRYIKSIEVTNRKYRPKWTVELTLPKSVIKAMG